MSLYGERLKTKRCKGGKVSKETVVLRRWGVLQNNLVLSTAFLIM